MVSIAKKSTIARKAIKKFLVTNEIAKNIRVSNSPNTKRAHSMAETYWYHSFNHGSIPEFGFPEAFEMCSSQGEAISWNVSFELIPWPLLYIIYTTLNIYTYAFHLLRFEMFKKFSRFSWNFIYIRYSILNYIYSIAKPHKGPMKQFLSPSNTIN